MNRKFLLVILLLGVALLSFLGYIFIKKVLDQKQNGNGELKQVILYPDDYEQDKDRDGILDSEEKKLGLSNEDSDSDNDGISDYVEINEYKTDPKNPDTDGDGYKDGVEIMANHNPLGN
jgi:hypothetical protein